jgi:DNA-binding MarR family transcriptional regulator
LREISKGRQKRCREVSYTKKGRTLIENVKAPLKKLLNKSIVRLHKTGSMVEKLFIGNAKRTIIANLR